MYDIYLIDDICHIITLPCPLQQMIYITCTANDIYISYYPPLLLLSSSLADDVASSHIVRAGICLKGGLRASNEDGPLQQSRL